MALLLDAGHVLFRSGRWWLAPLGAVLAIARAKDHPHGCGLRLFDAARQAMAAGGQLGLAGGLRNLRWLAWLRNIVLAIGIGAVYVWWAEKNFQINSGGHDMPLENAMGSLKHQRIFMEGWVYGLRFYSLVFVPLGVLAVLAPMVAAPAVALVLLHMTVPDGHGVDRSWSGHSHHMAPALAFALAGVIIGGGRLMRWLSDVRLKWLRFVLPAAIMAGTIGYGGWWWGQWSEYYNLRTGWTMQKPEWEHPGWRLMAQLPEEQCRWSARTPPCWRRATAPPTPSTRACWTGWTQGPVGDHSRHHRSAPHRCAGADHGHGRGRGAGQRRPLCAADLGPQGAGSDGEPRVSG